MAGIYVHIPFCKKKCSYCDFYSVALREGMQERYVKSVIKELCERRDEISGHAVTTLYIGGGTPSLLDATNFTALCDGLRANIDLTHVEEFTIEVNPDDVTASKVRMWRQNGVNRVSMGIQSLNDKELMAINRRHDSKQAIDAASLLKTEGINNISVDLIYGLPGQTFQSWKDSIKSAIELGIQHISAYCLSYEEGTRLYYQREKGVVKECAEEDIILMYQELVAELNEAGFDHYEISNFALPGYYSQHNSAYWDKTPYLGLGPGAHSFDGRVRRANPHSLKAYIEAMDSGAEFFEKEELCDSERYDEDVMVRLRTRQGISTVYIRNEYGEKMQKQFERVASAFVERGEMNKAGNVYVLTETGVLISDYIIRELMSEE